MTSVLQIHPTAMAQKIKLGGYLQGKTEGSGRGSRETSDQLETILGRDVGRTIPKTNHAYGGRFARYSNMGGVEIPKWDVAPGEEYFKEMFRVSRNQITLLKAFNVLTSILLFTYFLYPLKRITVSYWT